jgi:hypothetical protein
MGAVAIALLPGCYDGVRASGSNSAGEGGETEGDDGEVVPPPEAGGVGVVGLRRLSRTELDHTLRDLVGDDTRPASQRIPEDVIDPFDNDYTTQYASSVLIEGIEALAIDVSRRLMQDVSRRDMVVGCQPSGANDAACMESFIRSFGRKALRRPLTQTEVDNWLALGLQYATEGSGFYEGVDAIVRLLLQHPSFIYRVELGTATEEPGVYRLDDFEVATRLSYFVWGSTPDDELLDRAEAGRLGTTEELAEAAQWMLDDPRARARIDRFHAMWLGYYTLPHAAELTNAMREETRALLDEVIFDNPRSYMDVFRATGTFVNDTLAQLYGLTPPGSDQPVWVDYGDTGRQGLLSHGSFLSVLARFGDTSPTQRGILIRTRLLCQSIPPPPPDVDVDNPPEAGEELPCKQDRYEAHRDGGTCQACHQLIDPVGFGLEQYDQLGRFRTHEEDAPECEITGEGEIDGTPFNGPAGLADYIVDNQLLDTCFVSQVYRFAMGHEAGVDDMRYLDDLSTAFRENDHRFDQLVLSLVADEAFSYRREEE